MLRLYFLLFTITIFFILFVQRSYSLLSNPPNVNQEFVTYQKQSNFIHEFNVPSKNQNANSIRSNI